MLLVVLVLSGCSTSKLQEDKSVDRESLEPDFSQVELPVDVDLDASSSLSALTAGNAIASASVV